MGDVDLQTVAGAISTGTHGTGGRKASLSAQVVGLELVTADGSVRQARADGTAEEADLLGAARIGLGALGIITTVTFEVEPAFTLSAVEKPMSWSEVVDGFDELAERNEHFEAYWFPHTDRMLTKQNNRAGTRRPLPTWRSYLDDELLSNTLFGVVNRVGDAAPAMVPRLARLSARALSARSFSDSSDRVFVSPRRVVFREMEYAVPRESGMQALTEARALIEKKGWRISFPVEIRHAPEDGVWLSTAHDRASVYLAFHVNTRTDHREYFAGVEQILEAYDGRPHWGKLHTRTAEDLAPTYPRHADFVTLRDRLDPDRMFTNDYLDRVLGS
jgi:L-gulonolactone oxidase